jgi:hypothetical protein
VIFPWPLKNWLWTGDPAAPFVNRVFLNPYIHASFESTYRHFYLYLPECHSLPWKLTFSGSLGRQIGPVFLLAPLALLSLRFAEGPAAPGHGLVFPASVSGEHRRTVCDSGASVYTLAMALALDFSRYLPMALVKAAAVCALAARDRRYRAPAGTWQIGTTPCQAALDLTPPEGWLEQRSAEYRIAHLINEHVPTEGRVWSTMQVAERMSNPIYW